MSSNSFALARLILLEAIRSRMILLVAFILVAATLLVWFLGQITITETSQIQIVSAAGFLRVAAVFIVAILIIFSQARETADKATDLLLSLPIPRINYYLGKVLGYLSIAWICAACASLFLYLLGSSEHLWLWFFSLGCELSIVVTVSLFFSLTIFHPGFALTCITAFYLLARSINVFQMIGNSALEQTYQNEIMSGLLNFISFVLPRLDLFTQSAWLVSSSQVYSLFNLALQTIIYVVFISSLSLFDLYRKSF